jgi:hypothetical protein
MYPPLFAHPCPCFTASPHPPSALPANKQNDASIQSRSPASHAQRFKGGWCRCGQGWVGWLVVDPRGGAPSGAPQSVTRPCPSAGARVGVRSTAGQRIRSRSEKEAARLVCGILGGGRGARAMSVVGVAPSRTLHGAGLLEGRLMPDRTPPTPWRAPGPTRSARRAAASPFRGGRWAPRGTRDRS